MNAKEFNKILKEVYKIKINEATKMFSDVSESTLLQVLEEAYNECMDDLKEKILTRTAT